MENRDEKKKTRNFLHFKIFYNGNIFQKSIVYFIDYVKTHVLLYIQHISTNHTSDIKESHGVHVTPQIDNRVFISLGWFILACGVELFHIELCNYYIQVYKYLFHLGDR